MFLRIAVASMLAFTSLSCSALKDLSGMMANLSRLQFKLASVNNFHLAGIQLDNKSSVNLIDGAQLLAAFSRNQLPATFTLTVAAVNPNDGTGGNPKAAATLTSLAWRLIIDSTMTIDGNIADPITIPGTGQQSLIPLQMQLDLVQFFKDKGYERILNLALAIGGLNGSPSRLTLRVQPTVKTEFGPISYPGEIDVIDKEFR